MAPYNSHGSGASLGLWYCLTSPKLAGSRGRPLLRFLNFGLYALEQKRTPLINQNVLRDHSKDANGGIPVSAMHLCAPPRHGKD